jgi:Domain of unknown function (DUF6316)
MSPQSRASDADPGKRYFRSDDRVFRQGDGWYYSAREGDRGPYRDEKTTRQELKRFIQEQTDLLAFQSGSRHGPGIPFDLNAGKRGAGKSGSTDVWEGRPDVE